MSPALAGRFLTIGQPGKFIIVFLLGNFPHNYGHIFLFVGLKILMG